MPFTMMEMMKGSAMEKRRRVKHEKTFEERLAEEAQRFKEAVDKLLTARPGNYFYGGLAKLRRRLTSMSGRVRPDCSLPPHWKTCCPIRRSKAASVGGLFVILSPPSELGRRVQKIVIFSRGGNNRRKAVGSSQPTELYPF